MNKTSLDVFLNGSFDEYHKPDDMGLFTFYRQQEEREECSKTSNKGKKSHQKKIKFRSKNREQKRYITDHKQQSFEAVRQDENCSYFLKNICKKKKNLNHKFFNTNNFSRSEQMKHIQKNLINSNEQFEKKEFTDEKINVIKQINDEKDKKQSARAFKTFDEILKQDKTDQPCKLQKFSQLCKKKMTRLTLKVRTQASNPKQTKFQRFVKDNQQIYVQNNELNLDKNLIKVKIKSLQQSFMEKIRIRQRSKETKAISNQDEFHRQNKKYISTLIDRFQLPQNCGNQAAKILRQTLKFPNLSFMGENTKTESNSPSRIPQSITNDTKSFSFRKKEKNEANYILHISVNKSKNRFYDKFSKKDNLIVTKSIFG